jgi:hypothetical protein
MALPLSKEIVELQAQLQQDYYKAVPSHSLNQVYQITKVFSFIATMQFKTLTFLLAAQTVVARQVKWAG